MYQFSHFKEKDQKKLLELIEQYPLAIITGKGDDGFPVATQIPMLLEERDGSLYLQGHIMRNTDHHKAFINHPDIMVVFTGPDAYVSASWYSNPSMGSTWNYMSIQVKGRLRFMEEDELWDWMRRFTLKFEQMDSGSPTIFDNLPDEYVRKMMPAIVGIEVAVEKLDHVFKLSQNRDEASYRNIISRLEMKGGKDALLAKEMRKRLK